jgi:uncharacterized protein (DUF305 family)
MSWRRQAGFAGVWIALIMLLMACGSSTATSSTPRSASATVPASGNIAPEWLVVNGQYSDQRFIDMMVPHHIMAVQMAQVALQKGQHPEIKQLANSIISSQQREIQALKNLKKRLYRTSNTPTMMNPVDMANTGMLMPDQLAQQHPFDRAFIDSMIPHHASAIDMASVALMRSTNPEIKRIARAIVDAQSQEIGHMIQWRKLWYPGSTGMAGSMVEDLSPVDVGALPGAYVHRDRFASNVSS